MSLAALNPRSTLHALQPLGRGTPEVESLLSYFCRLAVSHSVSVSTLSQAVAVHIDSDLREGFDWHERNLSGMGEAALSWAAALSSLTSVSNLDRLTLAPWRHVIAQKGATVARGRWCPDCFAEDRANNATPYFRLSWEVGAVDVCHKHRCRLVSACPECGNSGARHKATYVVPGWCSHCGVFLGVRDEEEGNSLPASPEEMWSARQVGLMLAEQQALVTEPCGDQLREALRLIVTKMDNGKSAHFAKRIGLGKATVHNWLNDGGVPSLTANLLTAAHAGLPLPKLLNGHLDGWEAPRDKMQLDLGFLLVRNKKEAPKELDWAAIKAALSEFACLPAPISLAEAGRRLGVDTSYLYLRANTEARVLGERWKTHLAQQGRAARAQARMVIEEACRGLLAEGRAINMREVQQRVPSETLSSVERLFELLDDIKAELAAAS